MEFTLNQFKCILITHIEYYDRYKINYITFFNISG